MATVAKSTRSTSITLTSASAGPFDLDFRLFDEDALVVYVNGVPADFTLSASFSNGYDDNATVTLDEAAPDAASIIIDSDLFPWRAQDFINGPGLTEKLNIEQARIWSSLSDRRRDTSRSVRFMQSIDPIEMEAGRAIIVNDDGTGIEMGPTASEIASAQAYAEIAQEAAESIGITLTDQFVGDGSTTAFALSRAPVTDSNIVVVIDGIEQKRGTYSVSGTTLTFTEAPQAGSDFWARINEASTVFVAAAENVVTDDGDTVQDKLDQAGYATRAAFVAAVAAGKLWDLGNVVTAGTMQYRRADSATAIADLPGWLPFGDVYPDHFAANTTPGTTDMAAAINAALDYSLVVNLRAVDYYVGSTIEMYGRGQKLFGEGPSASTITADTDGLDIVTQDSGESQIYEQEINDVLIRFTGGTKTSGAHIRGLKYARGCTYRNVHLRNVYDGWRMDGLQLSFFSGCIIEQYGIATSGKGRYGMNFGVETSGGYLTDVHITDCQILMQNSVDSATGGVASIRANQVDGLYIENSHFAYSDHVLLLDPADVAGVSDFVASIKVTNCYLDQVYSSHVKFGGSATWYKSFDFTGCTFRAALGSRGSIEVDADIENLTIVGGSIRFNEGSGIWMNTGLTCSGLVVSGVSFVDNNESDGASHGDIAWRGSHTTITGCTFRGGSTSGWGLALLTGATDADLANNNISSKNGSSPIYTTNATNVWIDGVSYGSDANGEWQKDRSGNLQCWHSKVSSSGGDTTWTYPQAFKTGTVPVVSLACPNLSGPAFTAPNISGAPSATAVAFNVFNSASARQAVTTRLHAIGRYK